MPLNITKPKLLTGGIALLVGVLLCAILAIPTRRSGEELFQSLVLNPIPTSVVVLHSQDNETGFDGRLWLHFKIAPEDFDLVVASEKWELEPDISSDVSHSSSTVADWWKPQSLGDGITQYSKLIQSDGTREKIKYMWVNLHRTEVFLLYQDDFTH